MKQIQISKALHAGWDGMKNNLWLLLGLAVVYILLAAVGKTNSFLVGAASWVAQMAMLAVIIVVCIRIMRQEGAKQDGLGELPLSPALVAKFIAANILTALIVIGGLILLIVPGVIWALKYSFAAAFVLEEDCDIMDALRKSDALTQGVKWELLAFGFVLIGICILGLLCLVVGILPAMMVAQLAWAWVYVDLRKQMEVGA